MQPASILQDVLKELGEEDLLVADGMTPTEAAEQARLWTLLWSHSQAVNPGTPLPFLDPAVIRENWRDCSLPGEAPDELFAVAAILNGTAAFRAMAWHLWWVNFHAPTHSGPKVKPRFSRLLGDRGAVAYLVIALDFCRLLSARHRAQGIDPAITVETAREVACFADNYRRATGKIGLFSGQFFWLYHYLHEPYVRLGRLEFWYRSFPKETRLFRHRTSGELVCLATGGLVFNENGQTTVRGTAPDSVGCWTSIQEYRDGIWRGHRVARDGVVERGTIELSDADYECILGKGSPVLDVHIPSGGGLTVEALHDSFARARSFFFPRYPVAPPVAAVCFSWMFTRDTFEIMEPSANLPRVLRELQLFPTDPAENAGPGHVFMQEIPFSLATAPRDSSLQRAILAWLEAGNPWRGGGMLHLL